MGVVFGVGGWVCMGVRGFSGTVFSGVGGVGGIVGVGLGRGLMGGKCCDDGGGVLCGML